MRPLVLAIILAMPTTASAQCFWNWWAEPTGRVGQPGPLNWSLNSNRASFDWLRRQSMFGSSPSAVAGNVAEHDWHPISGAANDYDLPRPQMIYNPYVCRSALQNQPAIGAS